ncbi:MAG: P63C domain-containing protein [Opitutaceae bacterium]|nr:P63C domain-containing protein [Opitutaceae bacterium]
MRAYNADYRPTMNNPSDDQTAQSLGGKARAESMTQEQLSQSASRAAQARWDVPKATHSGVLKIGDMEFPCSVLSNSERILTQTDFMKGMGMYYSGWMAKNRPQDPSAGMPHFLAFKNLEPFIGKHLGDLQSVVVKYRTESGNVAHGIKAAIIPKICEIWMDAEDAGTLGTRQKQIAQKSKIIIRALAHVGIVALVDESTGYQEVRNKEALQALLDAFLRKEFATWAKRFPDEFYKELFRLRGWEWKKLSTKRPMLVGKLTNDLVYERLAPGILEQLETKNPKDEKGRRAQRHHQWLTDDVGNPALAQHLHAVIAIMRAFPDRGWQAFHDMLDKSFPKRGSVLQLEFIDEL